MHLAFSYKHLDVCMHFQICVPLFFLVESLFLRELSSNPINTDEYDQP